MDHEHWNLSLEFTLVKRDILGREEVQLDGPDGLNHYLRNIKKEKLMYFRLHSGGGLVMLCGGIRAKGNISLALVETMMKSERYFKVLEDYLIPFAYCMHDKSYILCRIMLVCILQGFARPGSNTQILQ